MRSLLISLVTFFFVCAANATEGRVLKVLPQFLDEHGRQALTPSLYDRDAYQAFLRKHPAKRSALRYAIQWKASHVEASGLKLRLELRGVAQSELPQDLTLDLPAPRHSWFSHWAYIKLSEEEYKKIGEVTAWRVTLSSNGQLLNEQKSFLW